MQKINRERGVTLVALTIAVIILLIITSILIYNANDNTYIKRLTNMYNDISNLRDKVISYNKEYGAIPIKMQYTGVSHLKDAGVIGANDGDKFYVLDLEKLDGITLNFGRDYEKIKTQDYVNINDLKDLYIINEKSKNIFYVQGIKVKDNNREKIIYTDDENIDKVEVPIQKQLWTVTNEGDKNWYDYRDIENGIGDIEVMAPKLIGNMKPVKYTGPDANTEEQKGSKWANAITSDGSMWVWIPRYAYKITEGYHTNQAGTIEIAFLGVDNRLLNGATGAITTNPEEEGAGTTKWLVHPAFTKHAEYGGGFGEIPGIWVGKFETTGEYKNGDASKVSVKPGVQSLRSMTINDQYKAGMKATFGESVNLNSHMMKNSEWGATVYLAYSKYGTNKQKIEQNKNESLYTGGTNTIGEIYTMNKKQSTTHNATGVYDLNGGAYERTASYINNGNERLGEAGGKTVGDLYGATKEEQSTSTKYKTAYSSEDNQAKDYEVCGKKNKGDSIFETSISQLNENGTWFKEYANFPQKDAPFLIRGGSYSDKTSGVFSFYAHAGRDYNLASFRSILIP